jgi:hypothetical protein
LNSLKKWIGPKWWFFFDLFLLFLKILRKFKNNKKPEERIFSFFWFFIKLQMN